MKLLTYCKTLDVNAVTPANATIFPEYILPNVSSLSSDPEVFVRCLFAQCISILVYRAVKFLDCRQALKAHGTFLALSEGSEIEVNSRSIITGGENMIDSVHQAAFDASMHDIHIATQELLIGALTDPSSSVKRAVLHNVSFLCIFLGRQKTNDLLLSHMITHLNDRDWMLRHAFFEAVVDVVACVTPKSVEEYIFPLMVQALSGT